MSRISISFCFVLVAFYANMASAQVFNRVKGIVTDFNDDKIEYFTAVILNSSDSSMIVGGAFNDGYFEFVDIKLDTCILQISCVGYQPITKSVGFTRNSAIDIGTIQMKPLELDEVIVRANRPIFRQKEGILIVNVKDTPLSDAGNLFDILRRSPGLVVDNENNITILGKGKPIVFINNREVQNNEEIESLQSDNISDIEINRNPSAEYGASGKAIVRIRTKKIDEGIKFQLFSHSYFARKYRNESGFQLNNKMGKTSSFLSYTFGDYRFRIFEDQYEINHQGSNLIDNRSHSIKNGEIKKYDLFASITQEINEKSNLGFQYSYMSNIRNQKSDSEQRINKTDKEETAREIFKDKKRNSNTEIFDLNYEFNFDSTRSLTIVGDYSSIEYSSKEDIQEKNIANNSNINTLINNRNDYDIYSGAVDYKAYVFSLISLQTGIKLSKVENSGAVISTDQTSNLENYNMNNQIEDQIKAVYFTLGRRIKPLDLKVGLRYEHTKTNISQNGEIVLDSIYHNWFPSFSASRKFSDKLDVTLAYSKKIDRPRFDELRSDITYFDSLSYSVGNPEIKPTISYNIDFTIGLFRSLLINFGHIHEENARLLSAVNDENNPDIIKYTPVNINKASYFFINVDYNYSGKFLNNAHSIGVEKPFIEIPYLEDLRKVRELSWYFRTNNNFRITDKTNIFAIFSYHSDRRELMTRWERTFSLSLGLNISFFEKKLSLALLANDILNSSDGAWEDKYGNIIAGTAPDNDNSWLRISIKYNFNNFGGGIKKKSVIGSELDRL